MLKSLHEAALLMDKIHHVTDIHRRQMFKERMIDRLTTPRILESPVRVRAQAGHLKMLVFSLRDTLIDLGDAAVQLLRQRREMLWDRLCEKRQTRLGHEPVFVLPLRRIEQVILEA